MQRLIEELHCPYCGSNLELGAIVRATSEQVHFGTLRCACYRYPIVDGIIVLRQNSGPGDTHDAVVHLIDRGQCEQALAVALQDLSMSAGRPSPTALRRLVRRAAGALDAFRLRTGLPVRPGTDTQAACSFTDDLKQFRTDTYASYLFHRYANNSFLAAVPFMLLLGHLAAARRASQGGPARKPYRVLDLGCGAGHSAFLLDSLMPDGEVIAADFDFANLYFARRHLVPAVSCVCMDADAPLAFDDGAVDGIFCLDAFHYIRSKRALSDEMQRILTADGIIVLSHLHNAAGNNRTPGVPLPVEHYERCFQRLPHRVVSESEVLGRFVREGKVDLESTGDREQVLGSDVVSLVAGRRQDLWTTHHDLDAQLHVGAQRRLVVNPIYRISETSGRARLTMSWPNRYLEEECASVKQYLPLVCEVDVNLLRRAASGATTDADRPALSELVRSFVLVRLPDSYA